MNSKNFYIKLFYLLLAFFVASTVIYAGSKQDISKNKKLIKFSHKLHIVNAGVECGDCHSSVMNSTALSDTLLPKMKDCANCHDVEDDKNCNKCHYKDVYEPLVQVTPKLIFNHKFHLSKEKLKCTDCHKGLDKVDYGFEAKGVFPPMDKCSSCHNNQNVASNACESCHISTANLLPQTHKRVNFIEDHKFEASAKNADCATCHTNTFCETCHVSTTKLDGKNTPKDFYAPYSTYNFKDGIIQQKLRRVHNFNYVYTHGIDAKDKKVECQTCHQTETFCSTCHNASGGDYATEGFMPASHKLPNFTTIGVGSGGGEHAVLARRDIEQCAACHDIQAGDPVCVKCHTDNDGIKGTNPRTHPPGFMHDIDGDWHTSDGSVCYTCHITSSASTGIAGVGFCSYCHGPNP